MWKVRLANKKNVSAIGTADRTTQEVWCTQRSHHTSLYISIATPQCKLQAECSKPFGHLRRLSFAIEFLRNIATGSQIILHNMYMSKSGPSPSPPLGRSAPAC